MIKFGTDGWRAIIGQDFTFENVARVAQAYAEHLGPTETPILLGYDRRFQSPEFAKTVASVLAANGHRVLMSKDYCPTPCVSWMTKFKKAPGGVMITASHNPFQWNGIKFKEGYGGAASPQLTRAIEQIVEMNEKEGRKPRRIDFETAASAGQVTFFNPREEYVKHLRGQVDLLAIQKRRWKIAYDPLFGAGAGFIHAVLETPVEELHGESNPGFGGIHPEPIAKNLGPFIEWIKQQKADAGLTTDGDADRIGAVDENGQFVTPHQIFALLLNHLLEKGLRGDIVKTVSTTQMIDRIAARHGLTVHETPIGFKHICAKFLETKPLIGGEESGGIGIPSHLYERDGLLAGLMLLEVMSIKGKRLGELVRELMLEFGPLYFEREDLTLSPEAQERAREKLARNGVAKIGPLKVVRINPLDGMKYCLEDGSWLLIRPSGTEPLIRLYAEAADPSLVRQLLNEGRKMIDPRGAFPPEPLPARSVHSQKA